MTGRRNNKVANKLRRKAAANNNNNSSTINGNGNSNSNGNNAMSPDNKHNHNNNAKRRGVAAALFEYDKCHNTSAPCCNALRNIVNDIFPDVALEQEKNANANANANANLDASVLKGEEMQPQALWTSEKSEKDKSASTSSATPSLFSLMVRKHLLEDRMRRLGGNLNDCESKNENGSSNCNETKTAIAASVAPTGTSTSTSTSTLASKKKRRKKKKKSKASDNSNSVVSCQSQSQSQSQSQTKKQSLVQRQGNDNVDDASKLDTMLDQILIQPQPSSIILPQNRDLVSLFEYVSSRCQPSSSLSQTNSELSSSLPSPSPSSPPSKTSKHNKQSNRRGSKSTSNSNSNDNNSSNNSTHTCVEIPTIPMQEMNEMINQITCKDCEISCIKYLERISYHSHSSSSRMNSNGISSGSSRLNISSGLDVGWGGYQDQVESNDNDNQNHGNGDSHDNDIDIDNNNGYRTISSISLDKKSVALNQDKSQSQSRSIGNNINIKSDAHAFDYDLMEEGGYANANTNTSSNSHGSNGDNGPRSTTTDQTKVSGLHFDLIQENGSLQKSLRLGLAGNLSFTMEAFDCLMKDVIFPCGLKEEALLTKEDVKKLKAKTEKLSEYLSDAVRCSLPQTLSDAQKALDDAEEYLKSPGAFNVKAIKSLRNCCQLQFLYMEKFREFLSKLESRTVHMQTSKHEHQKWVCDLMNRLWNSYMNCSSTLVEPSLRCMWEGIQLDSNRTGSIPLHCNSPPQRENLKKMLEKRLLILVKLQDKVESELLSCPENIDGCSLIPVLRVLATFGEYFALKEDIESKNLKEVLTGIDSMMQLQNEMICSTINQTDVDTIKQMQSDRCSRLHEKIMQVCKIVNDRLEFIDLDKNDRLTWQANTIMIEENMMAYEENREGGTERSLALDLNEVLNLCEFSKNILYQFRFYSAIEAKSTMGKSHLNGQIPTQVMKICEGIFASLKCEGSCGLRRVSGILSAYLYFWLQQRCMEWHADLTHQELMIETEKELLDEVKENAANDRKKKAKKKKKKRKGSTKISSLQGVEAKELSESLGETSLELVENRQISPIGIENFPLNRSPSDADVGDSFQSKPIEIAVMEDDASSQLATDETAECASSQEGELEEEYIQVCVIDKGEKMSVEDFLCARYFNALGDDNFQTYD